MYHEEQSLNIQVYYAVVVSKICPYGEV